MKQQIRVRSLAQLAGLLAVGIVGGVVFTNVGESVPPAPLSCPAITATEALQRLKEGNERFRTGKPKHPNQGSERVREVAECQHPFAVIVSCSDSRVPPEIVFDGGVGDFFVVREAGHVTDAAAIGSIEYAVEHLQAPLVVVLGHDKCGAVSAAAEVIAGEGRPAGHIVNLVDAIRPAIERSKKGSGDLVARAVRANVDLVTEHIRGSHPILCEHLADGTVEVVGAVYDLKTGAIEWR